MEHISCEDVVAQLSKFPCILGNPKARNWGVYIWIIYCVSVKVTRHSLFLFVSQKRLAVVPIPGPVRKEQETWTVTWHVE